MSYTGDLSTYFATRASTTGAALTATTKKDNSSLDMTDFLSLMVAQFQNQSIDSTADTSDMLNQLVQMQMVTALTNMTDATIMTYAGSLVGKEVTIGQYNTDGKLEEIVGQVTGTGTSGGEQVIFVDGVMYHLSDIMAIGRLPSLDGSDGADSGETDDSVGGVEGGDDSTGGDDSGDSAGSADSIEALNDSYDDGFTLG